MSNRSLTHKALISFIVIVGGVVLGPLTAVAEPNGASESGVTRRSLEHLPARTATGTWEYGGLGQLVAPAESSRPRNLPAAGASPEWLSRAEKQVREAEYEITWQSPTSLHDLPGAWHAPNRAHGFRTYFTEQGFRTIPRSKEVDVEAAPHWEWGLTLIGYGRGVEVGPVDEAARSTQRNRIDYDRGDILEWYVNGRRGLEHGFTLDAPPGEARVPGGGMSVPGVRRACGSRGPEENPPIDAEAASPCGSGTDDGIYLVLELTGTLSPKISADEQSIGFMSAGGPPVVRYSELKVTDATGRPLPARMEVFAEAGLRGLRLAVGDEEAVYPLTIDLLVTSPTWTAEGDQGAAFFGYSVATAGDVNGDGFSDVVVGAYRFDNGQTNEGRAFVYHGTASGLAISPAWTAESDQAGARFGWSVATAGDVNGDGFSDVIVGADQYHNGETDEGRAYVYLGSASGLGATPAWTAESDQAGANFGFSVSTAGDVNGDGFSDVIVGAPGFYNGQLHEGGAFMYLGSLSGLATTPAWTAEGDQGGAFFGCSVATAGDVNGDGFSDVVVGADHFDNGQVEEGRAFVYHGTATGLATSPAWTAESNESFTDFGSSVASAGDVNGDGFSDVIVGAPCRQYDETDRRRVYVYHGSAWGLAATPAWTASIPRPDADFGHSVASAGDVNGDGFSDVIIGAPNLHFDIGEMETGLAVLYVGTPTGLGPVPAWSAAVSDQYSPFAYFAYSVAAAGDVDGDGNADVIVGAPLFTNGQGGEGMAFVYHITPSDCADSDRDGYGFPGTASCPAGDLDDCNDLDWTIFPGAPEGCNGLDNDCDGVIPADEVDADGDGYFPICAAGTEDWDCDDSDPTVYEGAHEACDGKDNDCDGLMTGEDEDGDGYLSCINYHDYEYDCDDHNPDIYPLAPGNCDGVTNNCRCWPYICGWKPWCDCYGDLDWDMDFDGFSQCEGDCRDDYETVYPNAPEICDGLNNDCNDANWPTPEPADSDDDHDGFPECMGDCDDSEVWVYPNASEICDGLNNDCLDPRWPRLPAPESDDDRDGFSECGGDCNDARADVYPGAPEIWDRIDNDCDGVVDEDVQLRISSAIKPTTLNRDTHGTDFTMSLQITDVSQPTYPRPVDGEYLERTYLSRVGSVTLPDPLSLPCPGPGGDYGFERGISDNPEDRVTAQGGAGLRFNRSPDGDCRTLDGDRQDLLAILADVPDGTEAAICVAGTVDGIAFDSCTTATVKSRGNR